jgi:hypothetical protein
MSPRINQPNKIAIAAPVKSAPAPAPAPAPALQTRLAQAEKSLQDASKQFDKGAEGKGAVPKSMDWVQRLAAGNLGSPPQVAAGKPQTLIAKTQISGPDIGSGTRADLKKQLQQESKLNSGSYSRELSSAADKIPSSARITDGSYSAAENGKDRLRAKVITNPLEIAKYSGTSAQAVARVKQFDQQIEAKENDAKRWAAVAVGSFGKLGVAEGLRAKAEAASLGFDRGEFINNVRLQSGKSQNGNMYQANAKSADASRTPVIFVNGVNTDVNRSRAQALELSDRFGSPVNHIVNVSSKDKMVRAGLGVGTGGALREGQNVDQFDQRVQQHLTGNRPAATATANAILDQMLDPKMRADKSPVKVVGYSQGASITAQALRDVDSHLSSQVISGKLSPADKTDMLKRVNFVGIGPGAAARHLTQDYVKGGQIVQRPDLANVNYRIIADKNDQIANLVGVGKAKPDSGAAAQAALKLANNDFRAHLSYFRAYEAADPGSVHNPQVDRLLDSWFKGKALRGLAVTEGQ